MNEDPFRHQQPSERNNLSGAGFNFEEDEKEENAHEINQSPGEDPFHHQVEEE